MKKIFTLFTFVSIFNLIFAQVSTGFDGYTGPGTVPTEWIISNGSSGSFTYTTVGNYGASAPAARLDNTNESITTPVFSLATGVQFFAAGQSLGAGSSLLVEQFDGTTWTTVINLSFSGGTLFNTNTTYGPYTLALNAKQVRLVFTKATGNIAIDDVNVIGGILPIKLNSFTAIISQNKTALNWNVAFENSIINYIIEKSNDGVLFKQIGIVAAQNLFNYTFEDNNNENGKSYYRLKIVESNGTFSYSAIKVITHTGKALQVNNIFPNPVTNFVQLHLNYNKIAVGKVQIIDALGKILITKQINVIAGFNSKIIQFNKLQKGIYQLQVIIENDKATQVLLVN